MRRMLAVVLVVGPMTVACGPQYQYVRVVPATTFARPGCRVLLEPVHSEALIVGAVPEGQYVADKGGDSADSYAKDKVESVALFNEKISEEHPALFAPGGPPDNTFILRPIWMHWEPGFYAYVANRPGVASFKVDVLTSAGQPLDEIAINGAAMDFSSGGRMRGALKRTAVILNSYINDKWACAKP
jgi:hypothetical protein